MQYFSYMQKIVYSILITTIIFLSGVYTAHGATIYVNEKEGDVHAKGDEIYVTVFFETEHEQVNAIEGSMVYDDSYFKLISINDSESFITSWVEQPTENGSSIRFSGIAVGGFSGRINPKDNSISPGTLFQAKFVLANEGIGSIHFENVFYFLNNPSGKELSATSSSYLITIYGPENTVPNTVPAVEETLPEEFLPLVTRDPLFFDGKYVVLFETKDKGSGMSHYEIKEGKGLWINAESPYLLYDQTLRSRIWVKAVDQAGNARVVTIRVSDSRLWYSIAFILLLIALLFYFKKWYFKRIDTYIEKR